MTAKEYLDEVYQIDGQIEAALQDITHMNRLAGKLKLLTGSPTMKRLNTLDKIIAYEKERCKDIKELVCRKREAILLIGQVTTLRHQMLLEWRYLNRKSWSEIALDMGCTMNHVYKTHRQAVRDFDIILKLYSK